jgi:hypothetical protein
VMNFHYQNERSHFAWLSEKPCRFAS